MFEWGTPVALVLVIPAAIGAFWRWRRRPAMLYSSVSLVSGPGSLRRWAAPLPRLLGVVAVLSAIVALARPQLVQRETFVESEGIDIVLAFDVSGSMETEDFRLGAQRVSRFQAARAVIQRFVEDRPDDRIALVVFGEEAFTQVPLTLDHDAVLRFLESVRIGMAGKRATAIGDALAVAVKRVVEVEGESKVVILLTDGQNNAGQVSPEQAAQAAASLGVKVYAVGVDGPGERGIFGFLRSRSELDSKTLEKIAEVTGGQFFRADDSQSLERVYQTIDQLEVTTAEVSEYVDREERFHLPLSVSLLCLLGQVFLASTVLRRLP
jgi:Ca-activated chloride channel family protein